LARERAGLNKILYKSNKILNDFEVLLVYDYSAIYVGSKSVAHFAHFYWLSERKSMQMSICVFCWKGFAQEPLQKGGWFAAPLRK
jgi:hypothetical protein